MEMEHLERQFKRMIISEADFKETFAYLETLEYLHPYAPYYRSIKQGLLVAAIVSYARPFLNNKGDDASSQLPGKPLSTLNANEKEFHKLIKDLRSKVVAHSDSDSKPVGSLGFPESGGYSTMYTPTGGVLASAEFDINDFKNLAFKMMMFCKEKARTIAERIKAIKLTQ